MSDKNPNATDDDDPLAPFDANRPGSLLDAIAPGPNMERASERWGAGPNMERTSERWGAGPNMERTSERWGAGPAHEAIVAPNQDRIDLPPPVTAPRPKPWLPWLIAALLIGLTITVFSVLGTLQSKQWSMHCTATEIVAHRGRSFPPWGTSAVAEPDLRPIQIDADSECSQRQANDRAQLEDWFITSLTEQATLRLARRQSATSTSDIDVAFTQLQQALLLTRTAERRDARKEVERLLGDVDYWRAAARLQATTDQLLEAAAQFDAAAQKRPRHVTDAASWAGHVRTLVEQLRAGPGNRSDASKPISAEPSTTSVPGLDAQTAPRSSPPLNNSVEEPSTSTPGVLL